MSFILEALKKSERERALSLDQRMPEVPAGMANPHAARRMWPLAVASGLVAGAVVAVIVIWQSSGREHASIGRPDTPGLISSDAAIPLPLAKVAELPPIGAEKRTPATNPPAAPTTAVPKTTPPLDNRQPVTAAPQYLSSDIQRQLPALAVTIHVYSPVESQRILYINNREYRRGDQIQEGLRVEEIVPEGVVLSYYGERFKLRRPY